jgi:ketosteroid isomerase-like protein
MKKLLVLLLLTLTIPVWSEPTSPKDDGEATAAITQLREGLVTSFKKRDVDSLLAYLDPQVVVTWQNGEVCKGPDAVRAFYNRMMTGPNPIVRELKSDPEVLGRHVYGDWAVSWGNLHDHFILTDGSDLPFNSVFTATIARRGERWLVTAFHTSINAFDNPVTSLTTRKVGQWTSFGGLAVGLILGLVGARWFPRKTNIA